MNSHTKMKMKYFSHASGLWHEAVQCYCFHRADYSCRVTHHLARCIQIDKVVLLGPQKERLVLAVDFSGTKRGRVFLIVTPYIDEQQHLKIKDVDYDIQTKSVLLHSAQWILDSKLKELMVSGFDIDLNPIMNETKVAIEQQMNGEISKGVWLTTVINSLTVHDLLLSEDHISIDLELIGSLKLKIK